MSKRILVIDDDQTLVALLKEGLESVGYEVAAAFDGLQGILQAHQFRPDLIILDFYMPGGGGPTVYERLRQTPDTNGTPIVFSTQVGVDDIRKTVTPSGNTYFLRKPVSLQQVLTTIGSVLGTKLGIVEPPPFAAVPPPPGAAGRAEMTAAEGVHARELPRRPRFHEFEVRVTYADTDKMGIIYYSNYFKYFEEGRTELMRSLGVRYRDLEVHRKLYLPAVEARCRYLAPSRYDDLLVVRTWLGDLGKASVVFENEIVDKDLGNKPVARGYSRHAVVNDLWRSIRVPDDLRKLLEPYVGKMDGENWDRPNFTSGGSR